MVYQIRWSPSAASNLDGICNYIARDSEYYAAFFAKKITGIIKAIPSFPEAGRIVPEYRDKNLREKIYIGLKGNLSKLLQSAMAPSHWMILYNRISIKHRCPPCTEGRSLWGQPLNREKNSDGISEGFYQHLMLCSGNLGNRSKAAELYRQCKEALGTATGLAPSAKTQAVYQSIVKPMR